MTNNEILCDCSYCVSQRAQYGVGLRAHSAAGMQTEETQPTKCNIQKSLEVMEYILNPEDRPYLLQEERQKKQEGLISRSAGVAASTGLSVQKQLELQDMVIAGL